MKISTKVRYGIKALKYIAKESSEGRLVRIKEISEAENISIQYLEQILFKLKNKDIIEGKRGPQGGYKFLKRTDEVTLHDLYVILDEDIKIIDCNEPTENKKVCSDDGCSSECIWGQMDVAMREIMKSKTLEDLLENSHEIIGE